MVTVASFRWFRFAVSGFSTCRLVARFFKSCISLQMASCGKSDFYRHVASLDESDKFVTTCRQQLRQAGKQLATILWRFLAV